MRIRTKLLLLLVLGALVPLLLSHFFAGRMFTGSMSDIIRDGLSETADQVAGRTDDQVQWIVREMSTVVEYTQFESFTAEELPIALEVPYRQLPNATVVALLDDKGKALAPPYRLSGNDAKMLAREPVTDADLARFAENVPLELALNATVAFGPVYASMSEGEPRMVAATAFPVAGDQNRWVLAVELSLADVCALIEPLNISDVQSAVLIDLRGHPIPEEPGVGAQAPEVELGEPGVGGHPLDAAPRQVDLQVESHLGVSHPVPPLSPSATEATYPSRKSAVCWAARSSRLTPVRPDPNHGWTRSSMPTRFAVASCVRTGSPRVPRSSTRPCRASK